MGIARFLKQQLAERGWTQKDLAIRAEMQPGSLTYIMKRDYIVPQLETLDALARALDLPLAQLIAACGFQVSRPGDVYLSAEESGLLAEIAAHPDVQNTVHTLLTLPPTYQRIVFALADWAREATRQPELAEEDREAASELDAAYRRAQEQKSQALREALEEAGAVRDIANVIGDLYGKAEAIGDIADVLRGLHDEARTVRGIAHTLDTIYDRAEAVRFIADTLGAISEKAEAVRGITDTFGTIYEKVEAVSELAGRLDIIHEELDEQREALEQKLEIQRQIYRLSPAEQARRDKTTQSQLHLDWLSSDDEDTQEDPASSAPPNQRPQPKGVRKRKKEE